MKIAGTIILYYPDENVIENISSYINLVGILYIIDNSETPSQVLENKLKSFSNITYIHDGENKGIAERLNHSNNLAMHEGFDWMLTMDQDSSFEEGAFINYLNCLNSFDKKENVSMFGINYVEKVNQSRFCEAIKVNHLITSGSVLNLGLIKYIGGFDEKLFIDEVDFEYCLRSVARGFSIVQFTNIFLNHNLGRTSSGRSFKTTKLTSRTLHSPTRLYYMTRNFLYVQQMYEEKFSQEIKQRKKILLNRFKNNVLYNKERFNVMKNIIKGAWDFRKKRMGKLE